MPLLSGHKMKLLQQPNRWSCALASVCMLLDVPFHTATRIIGHDGSEVLFPNKEEPWKRRSFIMDDLQNLCEEFGYALAPFEGCPNIEGVLAWDQEIADARIFDLMRKRKGLIEGRYSMNKPHLVAWDGAKVYDPTGPRCYSFNDDGEKISISVFWALTKLL